MKGLSWKRVFFGASITVLLDNNSFLCVKQSFCTNTIIYQRYKKQNNVITFFIVLPLQTSVAGRLWFVLISSLLSNHWTFGATYEVWQKSNETDFLLTMNFMLFTNQGYPLQHSSLGQLHNDVGVVSIVHSSVRRLLLEYLSACHLCSSG
jgi:hypothetical protein